MSSGFMGLSISLSGLFANQRALGVVSHNIANANTEGYSRQVMNMQAYKPQVLTGGMGTLGVGVDVTAVKQIRDAYLDFKIRDETSLSKEWNAKRDVLSQIESIFNEPSTSSISTLMSTFYTNLETLSKNPENLTARTLVRQTAISLSEGIDSISSALKNMQSDLNFQFKTSVNQLNGYAEQVVSLNKVIYEAELEGSTANDVRDQRALILDKMSELTNIDYYEDDQKRLHVSIGGHNIVSHFRRDTLKLEERTEKLNSNDSDRIVDLKWEDGNTVNLTSGSLKGLMDVRDNIEGDNKGIPYYVSMLNDFVDTFSDTFNEIHSEGFGLTGDTGYYMFTINNMTTAEYKNHLINEGLDGKKAVDVTTSVLEGVLDTNTDEQNDDIIRANKAKIFANNPQYEEKFIRKVDDQYLVVDRMKAEEMTIAKDLEDVNKIAAATKTEDLTGDASNITKMLNTRHDETMYSWGAPEDYIKSLVSNLGVDSAAAKRMATNQAVLLNEFSTSRDSVMGVSLDEEMANMIKFQTAYNANARMVNMFDEMLDLVVNRLGTGGR
ncbi:flagellar hook-associated protein FlgK [Fusibacter sp. 3D3]|uniref:flagellar hook-associated protein FlgK n=1 Tax=Fusibacter sp. 3D3 TaxID=1048380 RepID=UPI000852A678|nr:flagellar hook-associated protein FlgK [Fusibacter sp. 3D3]GAU75673.1 flagellar hook-associated protein FlgK [Fusibacter sp. 3D3]